MASSQHRCVFVGNIPYDATEEQLIEICREVGPVVSFRLVIDRETGKPKGYGFCEYKDEETALSARRNLQGYEINGRQLRVDFAENDKGADRNREQGRGGPGMAANVDPQKQLGGPVIPRESVQHQPIGLHIAITAATFMTGALGGAQVGMQSNQNGMQSQFVSLNDPLTLHLAKMSRNQLNEIMSEMKLMATQNKELSRQLLLAKPLLLKALFSGTNNAWNGDSTSGLFHPLEELELLNLQMSNLQQQGQIIHPAGLSPLAQKMQLIPKVQEGPPVPQNSLLHNQFSAPLQPTMRPQIQLTQHAKNQVLQQATLPGQSGVPTFPSIHPSVRRRIQVANSTSLNHQIQPRSLENQVQGAASSLGHNTRTDLPIAAIRSSFMPCPPSSDIGFQPGPSISSGIVQTISKDADRSVRVPDEATWEQNKNAFTNMPVGLAEKRSMVEDSSETINRPSKLVKLEDGNSASFLVAALNVSRATGSAPSQAFGVGVMPVNSIPKVEEMQYPDKQIPQSQLPPDVESTLMQQVLTLTPEQLSSLPPEQRQQVIQLQQALLGDQMQPS